ncbi:Oxidoreductase, short-chain dehydrogenase/reductase family [Cupriavidus sp. U2]|uniref:short-chain dehydrogenase/reductase n=1 Tax=Cupriavidus sp. U2 TaxID=2920269 RepID=UPI00129E6D28|nr:short-chain dehydrogenase/reductase [Cupriavidus sp. U2]KAI3590730.1 Oxidoreductase, short-chain dehydrogenase/reductase family [Cupriavidus sp. U2]
MDLHLQGKSVFITGGTRGIGLACARTFAAEGAGVTIAGTTAESVGRAQRTLKDQHGIDVETFVGDLSQADVRERLAPAFDLIDILVNNAGAIPGGGLTAMSEQQWRQAWDLKVFGYIDLSRMALPRMMARGAGVIVNVIGIAAEMPRYDYLCGAAGNAALSTFTRAVGAHATSRGVRVVGVNPGPTETDRLVTLYKARAKQKFNDESRWQEMLEHLPFGRAARADEMADLVVYLASARASYLSGVVVDADGGARYA